MSNKGIEEGQDECFPVPMIIQNKRSRYERVKERRKRMRSVMVLSRLMMACFALFQILCWHTNVGRAFAPQSRLWRASQQGFFQVPRSSRSIRTYSRLNMVNFDSNDAFEILNLTPSPNLDKKEIKRAYKRMALKFHPDVVINQQSSVDEKRKANDRFAKINWAYETLMGKRQDDSRTKSGAASSSSSAGGYTPPHRRTGSVYTSSGKTDFSTDWRDYMPKYDDQEYDAGGDSWSSIFGDLLTGVAGAAADGGGGVFRDFVEFLESNVDGYSTGDDDNELRILLQTGTLSEVAEEMDDTDLVVQQLITKISGVDEAVEIAKADLKVATRYSEKMQLDEKVSELQARKKIVDGYLKRARKRLLSLQSRYKELIVAGANDTRARGRPHSSSTESEPSSASSSPYQSRSTSDSTDANGDWKHQGFGSSGRRARGSSRRARRPSSSSYSNQRASPSTPNSWPSSSASTRSSSSPASTSPVASVPPHRRSPADVRREQDDRRRLRELKVDEEFDQLKEDLGL